MNLPLLESADGRVATAVARKRAGTASNWETAGSPKHKQSVAHLPS
jgi:hypothetical protein